MLSRNAILLGNLFRRRGQRTLKVLTIAVGAALAVAVYAVLALSAFLGHVNDRGQARDFGPFEPDGCIQATYRYDALDTLQYSNYLLADRCGGSDAPPGLSAVPAPGEVFVSPALNDLRATDDRMAIRFPHIDGLIGPDGLASANEIFSISGVLPADGQLPVGTVTFDRFGSSNDYLTNYLRFDRITLVVIGLIFTLLPVGFLIYASTRLSARMRERQVGLLAIMGTEQNTLRRALVVEAGSNVTIGAIVGTALAASILSRSTPSFVTWRAFPGDFSVSFALFPLMWIIILAITLVAAAIGARSAVGSNRSRRWAVLQSERARWVVFIIGLTLGSVSIWWNSDEAWPAVLVGRIATFAGLILVAAPLCALVGERLHGSADPIQSVIGARLGNPAGSLTRALGALAAGLFLLSAGLTTVNVLADSPQAIQQQYASDGLTVLEIRRPSSELRTLVSDYRLLEGNTSSAGPDVAGVLQGPCDVISDVVGSQVGCSAPELFGVTYDGQAPPAGSAAQPVRLSGPRAEALSGFILQVVDQPLVQGGDDLIFLPLPTAEATDLYNRLVGADPQNNVRIVGSSEVSGASELAGILDVFRLGALFAVVVAFLSVLISFVALLQDRRPAGNYLEIVGVPAGQNRNMILREFAAGCSPALLVSLFASWIWSLSLQSAERQSSLLTVAAPYALAFVATILAAMMIALTTSRRTGDSLIPDRDGLAVAHDVFATSR